jgi:hypothetical protein
MVFPAPIDKMLDLLWAVKSVQWFVNLNLGALFFGIVCILLGRVGARRVASVGLVLAFVFIFVLISIWLTMFMLPPRDEVTRLQTWPSIVLHTAIFGVFLVPLLCGAMPWALNAIQAWWTQTREA